MSMARAAAFERAGGRCEVWAAPGCTNRATAGHHRWMRSQGGVDVVENILAVCQPCHDWIHAHPAFSYREGWLLHEWDDEARRMRTE